MDKTRLTLPADDIWTSSSAALLITGVTRGRAQRPMVQMLTTCW